MTSEEAFTLIVNALQSSDRKKITKSLFDSENFGNFLIEIQDGKKLIIVTCDRSQILIDENIGGHAVTRLVVPSLYEISEISLLNDLGISGEDAGQNRSIK